MRQATVEAFPKRSQMTVVLSDDQVLELATLLRPKRILRAQDVQQKIGVKHSKFYEILKEDSSFPAQQSCRVAGVKGWWEHEVEAWMERWFVSTRVASDHQSMRTQ